ncbi:reverse transcriptase-like protein [Lederbergia sp. NSJ-179]|uniref:reverse transcriptase-like protein n=1 Tax=Lederbergia sp. NSJ-179 TaxID=2931402 RepID=UPI001FD56861|nr:reverse transcriptase-like protein [Lederbergia sp. NSJ-179]MCJ7839511.1 reverse transcriptase-like protein [Lederbergia sp. NSJ-179]
MKIKIKFIYKVSSMMAIPMESAWFEQQFSEQLLKDLQKTGRAQDIIIMDEMEREWNQKQFVKLQRKMEEEPSDPVVFFDGGYDRASKKAGIGIVIYYKKGNRFYRDRVNVLLEELENNNEAEYAALFNALLVLEEIGCKNLPVLFKGDAQGVIKQLQGEWPCYEEILNRWLDRIEDKIKAMGLKARYEVIPRNKNKEADMLASQALACTSIRSHTEIDSRQLKG